MKRLKRLLFFLAAIAVGAPAFGQSGAVTAGGGGLPQAPPAFTPPKNDKIAPPLEASEAVVKASPRRAGFVEIKMADGTSLHTWVVYPAGTAKAGVVLVIHDIYGMAPDAVAWPQAVGDQLAREGFIAIVPDLLSGKGLNGGNADTLPPGGAQQVIRSVTPADVVVRLDAAMAYGKTLPASNGKTGVIGFCWGGNQSFAYAIAQPALSAAVVYYGMAPGSGNPFAPDQTELGKLKVPVSGFYGGADARVTLSVAPTAAAAKQLGKSYESHIFDGAGHGFLRNQSTEPNYKAAEQAWPLTIAFFRDRLK